MANDKERAGNTGGVSGGDAPPDAAGGAARGVRKGITGALLSLLDLRRAHFGAHCRRVAELSREMGKLGGFSAVDQEDLETAALLHDVGFIVAAGDQLLMDPATDRGRNKPPHYMVGYSILNGIPGFERVAEAVLHHHEHFDGTGNPARLRGDRIPIAARIIAVVDAYDVEIHPGAGALASDEDAAMRALVRQQGYRLDPDLVNRFLFVLANLDPIRRKGEEEFEITPTALSPGMILSRDLRTLTNVLLLKGNTVMTRDRINRLLTSEKLDWLLAKAYVDARSVREEELPPEERKARRSVAGAGGAGVSGGKAKAAVLALDDSRAVCNAIRRELARAGIETTGATDVGAAVKLLASGRFDAAVTDIMMGGADGFDFLKEVKEKWPALHVVVLSGYPSAEHIQALKEFQNVVRFVTKPWSEQLLLASVEEAIAMTRAAQAAGPTPGEGPQDSQIAQTGKDQDAER